MNTQPDSAYGAEENPEALLAAAIEDQTERYAAIQRLNHAIAGDFIRPALVQKAIRVLAEQNTIYEAIWQEIAMAFGTSVAIKERFVVEATPVNGLPAAQIPLFESTRRTV